MVKTITVEEIKSLINKAKIIDLRPAIKYTNGHIPTAINIDQDLLYKNPYNYLNKYEQYYLYCSYGKNSINLCRFLDGLGFNVVNINGGYDLWLKM